MRTKPSEDHIIVDAQNIAFAFHPITEGSGKGVVIATEDNTVNVKEGVRFVEIRLFQGKAAQ